MTSILSALSRIFSRPLMVMKYIKPVSRIVFLILSVFLFQWVNATRYYVKTTGSAAGNGLSWANAKTLQSALTTASSGDTIWVAAGVYIPDRSPAYSSDVGDNTFHLKQNVKILGGFNGTETIETQRDWKTNLTILDGDQGNGDSCYHVVSSYGFNSACELNGFVIRNGNANGSGSFSFGNYSINRNEGGGIYLSRSTLTISNTIIEGNNATNGGGIYCFISSLTIKDVTIKRNTATTSGGGIYFDSSLIGTQSQIINTAIVDNSAISNNGGGLYNYSVILLLVRNVVFFNNSCGINGGAIYNDGGEPKFEHLTISSNHAGQTNGLGGAIYNTGNSNPEMLSSIFRNNTITRGASGSQPAATGRLLLGSDFYNDTAAGDTSQFRIEFSRIQNFPLFYSDTTNFILSGYGNRYGSFVDFLNELDAAGKDDIYRTEDDGLQLTKCSPLRDRGAPMAFLTNNLQDILNNTRDVGYTPDMGAYELVQDTVVTRVYVSDSATGLNNGTSWTDAFTSLQDGLDAACTGAEIWVSKGTYYPSESVNSNELTSEKFSFHWKRSSKIYGGFEVGDTSLEQRDWIQNETVLSGAVPDSAEHCLHVLVAAKLSRLAILDGFTLTKGDAKGVDVQEFLEYKYSSGIGGGMVIFESFPYVKNVRFIDNNASNIGGGMVNFQSFPILTNVDFMDNKAINLGGGMANASGSNPRLTDVTFLSNTARNGGGMYNFSASPRLVKVTFLKNTATFLGGGMFNRASSSPWITNVIFSSNEAVQGGGICNYFSSPKITNVVFSGNIATSFGGGLYNYYSSSPKVINTTFSGNTATSFGGGMYNSLSSSPVVSNSIFWGNEKGGISTSSGADIENASSTPIVTFTALQNYSGGAGCITGNPLFVNDFSAIGSDSIWMTADDGLRLKSNSPAVDSGRNDSIPTGITTDIIGSARIQNTTVNMGAYEDMLATCQLGSMLPYAPGTYTATYTDTSGGYICYCDTFGNFILALDTNGTGAVIDQDSVQLQIGANSVTTYTTAGGIVTNTNGAAVFNRKWNVNATTQPTSDVKVIYAFTDDEYTIVKDSLASLSTTVTSPSDLQMYKLTSGGAFADPHASGATGVVLLNGSTPSTSEWKYAAHANGTDHTAEFMVSSFSGGGGGGGAAGSPVPVELLHFTASAKDGHTAQLDWATASELNNSHFEILRSYDGITFEQIDVVDGNGTTNEVIDYAYTDFTIAKDKNIVYYQLNQLDYDGASELTEVRRVDFSENSEHITQVVLYPNPTEGKLYIKWNSDATETVEISITDINGKALIDKQVDGNATYLDLSEYKKGMYFVKVKVGTETKHYKVNKL